MSTENTDLSTHRETGRKSRNMPANAGRKTRFIPSAVGWVQLGLAAFFLTSWQVLSDAFDWAFWVSSPKAVFGVLVEWGQSGLLWQDVKITMAEAGGGFLIGSLAGGLVGFVLGWVRKAGEILEPFVLAIYTLPKVALAPLFVLWFGIGVTNKIMFAGLLAFFMVFFTTFQGVRGVDRDLVANVRLLGANRREIWMKVALPFSAIWIFAGLRIGLPYALIGAIVGEFIAAQKGVGYRIKEATAFFDTAAVFAGLVVLMFISSILLGALKWIENRALHWQRSEAVIKNPA